MIPAPTSESPSSVGSGGQRIIEADNDLEIKTGQFRDQMRGITFQSQLSEPNIQSEISAELNGLQLLQLATEQSLENHQTERGTAKSKPPPDEQSRETLLPWTRRLRQQS